jgi:hypothetical protein
MKKTLTLLALGATLLGVSGLSYAADPGTVQFYNAPSSKDLLTFKYYISADDTTAITKTLQPNESQYMTAAEFDKNLPTNNVYVDVYVSTDGGKTFPSVPCALPFAYSSLKANTSVIGQYNPGTQSYSCSVD